MLQKLSSTVTCKNGKDHSSNQYDQKGHSLKIQSVAALYTWILWKYVSFLIILLLQKITGNKSKKKKKEKDAIKISSLLGKLPGKNGSELHEIV